MKLEGKVAIVTGGGRGMGRAISLRFASEGARVVVASRTEKEITEVVSEIQSLGGEGIAVATDISNEGDVDELFAETLEEFNTIDILVNNGGVAFSRPLVETSLEEWKRVIDINLTGAFLCSKAALPVMIKKGFGKIINISSMSGKRGLPNATAYSASKFGMIGMTECLAKEVGPHNITVQVIDPGLADTTMGDTLSDKLIEKAGLPGRETWMRPEDIAEIVLLLATLDNRVSVREVMVVPTTQLGTNI